MGQLTEPSDYHDELYGSLYPFADTATLTDTTGKLTLPAGLFYEASVYPVGGSQNAGIRQIIVADGMVTIVVGDAVTAASCSAVFHQDAIPSRLYLADPAGRPAGLLLADSSLLAQAQTWPDGTYTFALGTAAFVVRCVIPVPTLVAGLEVGGTVLTDEVWLIGDTGVIFTVTDNGTIVLNVVGDPLSTRLQCSDATFVTPRLTQTITVSDGTTPVVLQPDASGRVHLVVGNNKAADTALRLEQTGSATLELAVAGATLTG